MNDGSPQQCAPESEPAEVRLVVGLGNPGLKYENTRHNAGFLVVDRVLGRLGRPDWISTCQAHVARGRSNKGTVWLMKPQTFMNNSGTAVLEFAELHAIQAANILVVYDCVDLPLGRIRLRQRGSSGGHRGVESVITELGTQQFPRLRVGIGRPESETIEYVLSPWASAEMPVLDAVLEKTADGLMQILDEGITSAMNELNGWSADTIGTKRTHGEKNVEHL